MLNYKTLIHNHNTIYIQGNSGTGKTKNILNFLKSHEYDYSYRSIQSLKNIQDFMDLLKNKNILKLFYTKQDKTKKVIILDNLDYLQNTDKKILSNIVKYFKNKNTTFNNICIIFIGINNKEKKIVELINVIEKYIKLDNNENQFYDKNMKEIVNDLVQQTYKKNTNVNSEKTIISLCYHENIVNYINNNFKFYEYFLQNFCNGDYYDRIAFQKQLWQFNEMTYFLKVLYNYDIYKEEITLNKENNNEKEIIFTKILTKYSNEYSNLNFIIYLCNKLNIQKTELYNLILENKESELMYKFKEIINGVEEKRIIKLITA